jgi:hypothetical protein
MLAITNLKDFVRIIQYNNNNNNKTKYSLSTKKILQKQEGKCS